jgi:hypothetical protein
MEEFVSAKLSENIKINVIKSQFPKLNNHEQNMLNTYLIKIINYIAIKFNFDKNNNDAYYHQFTQNNYQDSKGILLMLLPFINETIQNKSNIKTLSELYTAKLPAKAEFPNDEPKYIYSNIQYGRKDIQFQQKHLEDNFYLLKETIHRISNKLYVNWLDVRPIPVEDTYINYEIYKHTFNAIISGTLEIENIYEDKLLTYRGLSVQDIYEVIANKLYNDIKQIKWLIFDTKIKDGKIYGYYYVLNQLLSLQSMLENKKYNQLSVLERNEFDRRWEILKLLTTNKEIDFNTLTIIKMVTYYFDKVNYNSKLEYTKLSQDELNNIKKGDDIDETLSRTNIYDETIFKTFVTISSKDGYDFLYNQIQIFDKTWYGKTIKSNHFATSTGKNYLEKNLILHQVTNENIFLTLKNIYNYAKLISSTIENTKLITLPKSWKMLNDKLRGEVLFKINTSENESESWFKIMKYVRTTYNIKDVDNVKKINSLIYKMIKNYITGILLDVLANCGFLSQFSPEPFLTDYSTFNGGEVVRGKETPVRLNKIIQANYSKYKKASYFLTSNPYSESMFKYSKYVNFINSYAEMDYLNALASPHINMGGWQTTYAMNWISQIGFFHKYLNNRIIYVTGSTGAGKSTQIPKLLLYALAMIDYKANGKIICSQPRIPPTVENANTISNQMGVPIKEYSPIYKKYIKSDNYNILFKYKKDSHQVNQNGLQLNIVTDGTLLEIIKKSPILKDVDKKGDYKSSKNVYDIVIVDEAHEHNKNMDLILTFMKTATYYNNDIRLVIVSATMDDDEPNYRRYYKDINDNRLFPLNLDIQKYNIDRVNVDRRLHISPPNMTTRYEINEFYVPDKTPEEIVLDIAKNSSTGDILLFQPGTAEIKACRDILNKLLPPNFIALPFYSELEESKAEIIKKLNPNVIYNIRVPRDYPYEKKGIYEQVPLGTYTRVVIIATNIAEASITIDTLRYVVDTGTEKSEVYNYKLNQTIIEIGNISESSRLQRKGRIGRVAPGTVYYNYEKDKMINNKKKYGISTQNIGDTLFDLLGDADAKPLFDDNSDFNNPNTIHKTFNYGLENIYLAQYTILNNPYNYFGTSDAVKEYAKRSITTIYKQGYTKEIIDDLKGRFYIIHPNEIDFTRDISGNIIRKLNNNIEINLNNSIESYKINTFWKSMQGRLFLYGDKNMAKTIYGNYVQTLKAKFVDYTLEEIITLIYAIKYDVVDQVLLLISILKYTGYIIKNLAAKENISNFFKLYKSDNGNDIISLYRLGMMIIKYVEKFNILDVRNYKSSIENSKRIFLSGYLKENDIDLHTFETLRKMNHQNILENKAGLSLAEVKNFVGDEESLKIDFTKCTDQLVEWCSKMYLDYEIIRRILEGYFTLRFRIKKLIKFDASIYENIFAIPLNSFNDKITMAFIKGFEQNICKKILGFREYVSALNPSLEQIYKGAIVQEINEINPKATKVYQNTLINNNYNNYVIYCFQKNARLSIMIPIKDMYIMNKINPFYFRISSFNPDHQMVLKTPSSRNYYDTLSEIKREIINGTVNSNYLHFISGINDEKYKQYIHSKV